MPKQRFLQHSPYDPDVLPSLTDLTPERMQNLTPEQQQEVYERAIENERREQKEIVQDIGYDDRKKRKLKRELKNPKIKRDPSLESAPNKSQVDLERELADKFVAEQREKEPAREKGKKELEKLMSDPSIITQEPPGGYKCMNSVDGEPCGNPSALALVHGGLLGEGVPPIELCKNCSKLIKMIPRGVKSEESNVIDKTSHTLIVFKKLAKLATKLDSKGLYREADLVDNLLKTVES